MSTPPLIVFLNLYCYASGVAGVQMYLKARNQCASMLEVRATTDAMSIHIRYSWVLSLTNFDFRFHFYFHLHFYFHFFFFRFFIFFLNVLIFQRVRIRMMRVAAHRVMRIQLRVQKHGKIF